MSTATLDDAVYERLLRERIVFLGREVDDVLANQLAAQMLLLHVAGFSIATGIVFACTARAFGRRNLALTLPLGIVLSLAVWLVFSRLLMLHLPAGPLEHLLIAEG